MRPKKKWTPTGPDQGQDRTGDPAHASLASLRPGNQKKGRGAGRWDQREKPRGRVE